MAKICVFGDSVGKGVVYNADTGRYEILKMDLETILGKGNIDLKNYSMFGSTVTKGLSVVRRHTAELKVCDTVFLEFGGNDCDFAWNEVAAAPEKDHQPKTPLGVFAELYTKLIDEVRRAGARPVLLTLPPIDAQRYFDRISKGLDAKTLLNWLGDVDMIYRWHELYNTEVVKLAARLSVPLIDIRSAFLGRHDYRSLFCEDGIHPNREGQNLIYKTVFNEYEKAAYAFA